jgi:hypothetical protein
MVVDLGRLGEKLEATLKELAAVQLNIEAAAKKQARASASGIQVRLLIPQSDLKLAAQQIACSR